MSATAIAATAKVLRRPSNATHAHLTAEVKQPERRIHPCYRKDVTDR